MYTNINVNEKTKNILKIIGIALVVFFLYGLMNLFGGSGKSQIQMRDSGEVTAPEEIGMMNSRDAISSKMPVAEMMVGNDSIMGGDATVLDAENVTDKKIIKNGNLSLSVRSTDEAASKIELIAIAQGGEVFSTNFYERVKGQKSGVLTVKVPENNFGSAMTEIKKVATQVKSESITGQDVTEEYTDIETQIRNKKAEEESFLKILEKAVKIEDVLATTRELARVRSEIESLEGRMRYLKSQVNMSLITISLSEDISVEPIGEDWRIGQVFKEALSDLKEAFRSFINGIIRFIIVGIPSLIPFVLLIWLVYWAGRRIMRR